MDEAAVIYVSFRSSWLGLLVRACIMVFVEIWLWRDVYGPPRAHAGTVHTGPLLLAWLWAAIVIILVPLCIYSAFINPVQMEIRSDGIRFFPRGLIPWADIGNVEIRPAKRTSSLWPRWEIAIEAKARPVPKAGEAPLWPRVVAKWRTNGNDSVAVLDQSTFARPLKEIAAAIEAHRPKVTP